MAIFQERKDFAHVSRKSWLSTAQSKAAVVAVLV
jgi:hypothetical protein